MKTTLLKSNTNPQSVAESYKVHLLKCCTQIQFKGTYTLLEHLNSMLLYTSTHFRGKYFTFHSATFIGQIYCSYLQKYKM